MVRYIIAEGDFYRLSECSIFEFEWWCHASETTSLSIWLNGCVIFKYYDGIIDICAEYFYV